MLCGLAALGLAPPAQAQLSGSLALTSDYRLRGVSLTERRPALSLGAAYDHPSGAYAGGSVIVADTGGGDVKRLGDIEYIGIAKHHADGLSWDVGASNTNVKIQVNQRYPVRYNEVYAGVARNDLSLRVSYSPNYLHSGVDTLYADLSGVYRPAENWRLVAHVGLLKRLDGPTAEVPVRHRYDLMLAAVRGFDHGELRLAWIAAYATPHPHPSPGRGGIVVGASVFF